jgi:hypothetical protein
MRQETQRNEKKVTSKEARQQIKGTFTKEQKEVLFVSILLIDNQSNLPMSNFIKENPDFVLKLKIKAADGKYFLYIIESTDDREF